MHSPRDVGHDACCAMRDVHLMRCPADSHRALSPGNRRQQNHVDKKALGHHVMFHLQDLATKDRMMDLAWQCSAQ